MGQEVKGKTEQRLEMASEWGLPGVWAGPNHQAKKWSLDLKLTAMEVWAQGQPPVETAVRTRNNSVGWAPACKTR